MYIYNIGYNINIHTQVYIYTEEATETAAKIFAGKYVFIVKFKQ